VRRFARVSQSLYVTAADEILWIAPQGAMLHPRVIIARDAFALADDTAWIEMDRISPWRPDPFPSSDAARADFVAGCRELRAGIDALGTPDGLGRLLDGAPRSDLVLERARPLARALGRACRDDNASAAIEPAAALLGLGPGLTPSGDDFVGGALFARRLLAGASNEDGSGWNAASAEIVSRARERTHPISVALLSDMLHGRGHAPLHVLASALASAAPCQRALDSARTLTRLGHCSGWDMLTGFLGGVLGARAFR
jgi:hypothetical protein